MKRLIIAAIRIHPYGAVFAALLAITIPQAGCSTTNQVMPTQPPPTASPTKPPIATCLPPYGIELNAKRPHASLKGTITDADTGGPVEGAKVILYGKQEAPCTMSSADGSYLFGPDSYFTPDASKLYMEVQAPGYETLTEARGLDFKDNPDADPADSASNWDVQDFQIRSSEGTIRDTTEGYSITFPPDWEVRTMGNPEIDESIAWATSPERQTDLYTLCEVRSDLVDPKDKAGSPEEFWFNWADSLLGEGYVVLDKSAADINGITATRVLFTDGDGRYQYKGLAYFFSRGQEVWFVHCMVRATRFDDRAATFEDIAQSFKFE